MHAPLLRCFRWIKHVVFCSRILILIGVFMFFFFCNRTFSSSPTPSSFFDLLTTHGMLFVGLRYVALLLTSNSFSLHTSFTLSFLHINTEAAIAVITFVLYKFFFELKISSLFLSYTVFHIANTNKWYQIGFTRLCKFLLQLLHRCLCGFRGSVWNEIS